MIYGSGLGPAQLTRLQLGSNNTVTSNLAGTRILFNGTPAPLLYTWGTQVSAVVPFGITGSAAQVVAQNGSQTSAPISVSAAPTSPALFTADSSGQGQALANNADGSRNSASNPAKAGTSVTFFATGTGQTSPASTDGQILAAPLPKTAQSVTVTIGGQAATVQSSTGVANNVAGVVQVTAIIPSGMAADSAVPVAIQVGGAGSPSGVTMAISNN